MGYGAGDVYFFLRTIADNDNFIQLAAGGL